MNETLPDEIDAARLAYANACERMGMAHANEDQAGWLAAVDEEIAKRRALVSAILAYGDAARAQGREEVVDRVEELDRDLTAGAVTGEHCDDWLDGWCAAEDYVVGRLVGIASAFRPAPAVENGGER